MKGVGCPLTGQTSRTSVLVLATTTFWERKKISHLNHLVIYKYILLIPWIHIHHFLRNHSWRHIQPSASIKLSALTWSGTFVQTSVSTTKCSHNLQKKNIFGTGRELPQGERYVSITLTRKGKKNVTTWQIHLITLTNPCNKFDLTWASFNYICKTIQIEWVSDQAR